MTLEAQIASLVQNTSALLKTYGDQVGTIAQLQSKLDVSTQRISVLEKQIRNASLYSEMVFSSNYKQTSGLNKPDEEALRFKFSKPEEYQPKNSQGEECYDSIFDSDEEVRYLHDIPIPDVNISAELHILCSVGDIVDKKNKTYVSILRRNKLSTITDEFFDVNPSNPNAIVGIDNEIVFLLEGFGEKGSVASSTKHIVRNIIKIKDWKNGSNWGGFRIINLGMAKVRVHGVGIVLKVEGV